MIEKTDIKILKTNEKQNKDILTLDNEHIQKMKKIDCVLNILDIIVNENKNKTLQQYKQLQTINKQKIKEINKIKNLYNKTNEKINIEIKKKEVYKLIYELVKNTRFMTDERKKLLLNIINKSNDLKEIEKNLNVLQKIL